MLLNACSWNEWLTLPVKYSDLPRNAQLAFTVWDIYGPSQTTAVGGATISMFGKQGSAVTCDMFIICNTSNVLLSPHACRHAGDISFAVSLFVSLFVRKFL